MFDKLKAKVQKLKGEIAALYLVAQDPRTPWYAKIIVAGVVAYGLSPIGLIPHFIPVLGYLDDLVLLPVGIFLALKLIPPKLLADARQNAETNGRLPKCWLAAIFIVVVWIAAAILLGSYLVRMLNTDSQSLIGA